MHDLVLFTAAVTAETRLDDIRMVHRYSKRDVSTGRVVSSLRHAVCHAFNRHGPPHTGWSGGGRLARRELDVGVFAHVAHDSTYLRHVTTAAATTTTTTNTATVDVDLDTVVRIHVGDERVFLGT